VREFINGSDAIIRGAVDAGCDFFAGYPITPANSILVGMIREMARTGGIAVQAEDEIASIGFCIAASMTGRRVFTATSGPGMSLYSENIGLAIMGETPMVIADVQRMGPATGGATTGAEGDIQFIRWGTSGGYPVVALCPTNIPEAYHLTMKAFHLAEMLRHPVFLVTSKELVMLMDTVEIEKMAPDPVVGRRVFEGDGDFIPYAFDALSDVPLFSPIGGGRKVRFTTSIHDERAQITTNPAKIDRKLRHLAAKIDARAAELSLVKTDIQEGSETLVISFGVCARAVPDAVKKMREEGMKVSSAVPLTLWPVPENILKPLVRSHRRIVVAELNLGQYVREVERLATPENEVRSVTRVDGLLIYPQQIAEGCLEK
jgi:2-oxoglutarate ferredoxin oxidoreductase subunit alpha